MDRRVVITGLAAAVFAVPALAQTTAPTAQPGAPGNAASGNRMGGQMSQEDMQHMQQTLQLGMVALETSRIAQQKAQNANLKQFATFEVQEQTTISEVLQSMMDPSATAATSAQASGTAATGSAGGMQMPADARQMAQKLQSAQAGAEFDREYLQGQIQGHRDLLQVQERYLSSNPQNREHMNVAKMARTQIREHIALLEDMQQTIR
jgi:putative membrane protein